MIVKPSLTEVAALHSIVHTPAWADVNHLLQRELDETIKRMLATADTAALHELRGRARSLTEFLEVTKTTKDLQERLRK